MMIDPKPYTITVTNTDGDPMSIEMYWDANFGDWMHTFRTIMYWLVYPEKLIKEYLGEIE